jgi:uncharacterized protein (TIGR03083 family)
MATSTTTTHDYGTLVREELADLRAFLDTLTDEQWDGPTLCEGWRVRDVIGHMCVGYSINLLTFPFTLATFGFNVPKGSHVLSVRYGDEHTPAEIKENFARLTTKDKPGGLARVIKTHERFTDHLIHQQDIRRPMNKPREIPRERLVAALDALPRIGGFLKSNQKAKGLRFVATDIDYTLGDGREVRGPAESLILAISGRPIALPELEGDGLATLRERIGA